MLLLNLAVAAALSASAPVADASGPTIPAATIDDTLEITGEALAAEERRSRLFLDVRINGKGPFRFVVDSGADRSVVGSALAARLALPSEGKAALRSMAGSSDVSLVYVDSLGIGPSEVRAISAPALPERFIGAQGVIGIDALIDQRIMLDFDVKRVTIQDSRRPAAKEDGEIIVTARRRKGQLILTQVSVEGDKSFAVIDTGSELTLGNSAMEKLVFRGKNPPAMQSIELISVTGETYRAKVAQVRRITIGGIVLQDVMVAFTDAPPFGLFGLERQPALLLGTDLLKSFKRLSLDFRNRKVRFVLRR